MTPDHLVNDEFIITDILRREGRDVFTNRADDRGGATRWGITQEDLESWRGHALTPADVAALTEDEARQIYRHRYIGEPGFNSLGDQKLRWLMADCGVLHGTTRSIRWLQGVLGVAQDGIIGDETRRAIWRTGWRFAFLGVCRERIQFIGRIVTGNKTDADQDGVPDNMEMAAGWLNRAASFLEEAS